MIQNDLNQAITKLTEELSVKIYHDFNTLDGLCDEWDNFVQTSGGDIYLSFDWCRTWWKFYGSKRDPHIFIYRNKNNEIIGIIPLFSEKLWIGPVCLKIAKIIGSDFTIAMLDLPVCEIFAEQIFCEIFDLLIKKERCDAICLSPIGERYKAISHLRNAIQKREDVLSINDRNLSPYTIFLLPQAFDEYIQSLDKRQRGNFRRDINLLEKSFEITQDVISDESTGVIEFQKFIQMHTEQWEAENKLGHFNDWPMGVEFNIEMVRCQARKGRLHLFRLLADGNVVSYQLCYSFGNRLYWRLPARIVGTEWDKFALGRIGLVKEIEWSIQEGICEIEAGPGHYDYKIKLGGKEHLLLSFILIKNSLLSRLRFFIFIKISNLLHFLYYRIWFNKVAPKLLFKRKPLWKLWIRSRI